MGWVEMTWDDVGWLVGLGRGGLGWVEVGWVGLGWLEMGRNAMRRDETDGRVERNAYMDRDCVSRVFMTDSRMTA